jgi:protein-S-isoprenylcysteine O-methyltransferase Ste14
MIEGDEAMSKAIPRITLVGILILAGFIGGGGLFAFMIFLFVGSFRLVDLGLSEISAVLLNIFLCLLFFIQHSVMARKSFYKRSARFLPARYGGAIYGIASGVFVLVLVLFWQESTIRLIAPQGIMRLLLRALFFLAIANVIWALSTGFFALYRVQSPVEELRGKEPQKPDLITHGPYRWVRHPLYLSALLLLWSYPDLTLDRLLLNLLFTVWVIIGTLMEERKLLATYNDAYRSYQRRVPMLIPWRIRPGSPEVGLGAGQSQ